MRIGYPCINRTIDCKGNRTFRLKSYSEERLISTVKNNLNCLFTVLSFNVEHDILFFRITSDLVPFASHPVCDFDWPAYFRQEFRDIGSYIVANNIRISMHPGQYNVLNSPVKGVLEASLRELDYHAKVIDAMKLDRSAKIQLHIGGVYGNKEESMDRFARRFRSLDSRIKQRLVIENDDRQYGAGDCLRIHAQTGIPVIFDSLHHELNNKGEPLNEIFGLTARTWSREDGPPMVDYGSPKTHLKDARHAESIDLQHFGQFIVETRPYDYDVMLEIKDKEISALKAVEFARLDDRFNKPGN